MSAIVPVFCGSVIVYELVGFIFAMTGVVRVLLVSVSVDEAVMNDDVSGTVGISEVVASVLVFCGTVNV